MPRPTRPHTDMPDDSRDLIDVILAEVEAADPTRVKYRAQLEEFARWLGDPRSVSDAGERDGSLRHATIGDVQRFMAYLRTAPRFAAPAATAAGTLAPSTRKNYLSSLRSFYRYVHATRIVDHDPTIGVRTPKVRTKPGFRLDADELERLLDTPGSARERIQAYLMVFTAARAGELCALRWSDIDFPRQSIALHGKDGSHHTVDIHPRLMNELRRWYIHQQAHATTNPALKRALEDPECSFVLLSRTGRPLTPSAVCKQLKRRAAHAGLHALDPAHGEHRSLVSPHAIRRSVATLLLNTGHPLDAVADVLGHSRVDTTRKHYAFSSNHRRRTTIHSILK